MTLFDDPRVAELLGEGVTRGLADMFRSMEWAEEEIALARGSGERDPEDDLWRSFLLLRATHPLMATEMVYRAHCRELLARVSAGEDTRPATDTEIVCGISESSQAMPLHGAVVGLQARLFKRILPDKFEAIGIDLDLYERMHRAEMDEWEGKLRRKATQDWRVLERESPQLSLVEP